MLDEEVIVTLEKPELEYFKRESKELINPLINRRGGSRLTKKDMERILIDLVVIKNKAIQKEHARLMAVYDQN